MTKPLKPLSASDCIPLALEHARKELVSPFRFGFWTRMAVVAFFAGELGGGSGGFNNFARVSQQIGAHRRLAGAGAAFPHFDARLLPLIFLLAVCAVVVMFIFMYIHSVFRFILFNSALTGQCGIREQWSRWNPNGTRYFVFLIVFNLIVFPVMLLLLGGPIFLVWRAGVFDAPARHLPLLVGGGILFFGFALCLLLVVALISVAVRDFFIPVMALENCPVGEAWARFQQVVLPEKGPLAIYFLMKIALAIAAAVMLGIVNIFIVLIFLIPGILLFLVGVALWTVSHVVAVIFGILVGSAVIAVLIYLMAMLAVPVAVFFQMYTLYYLGWRYPPLSRLLWPPEPPLPAPPQAPPLPQSGPLPAPA